MPEVRRALGRVQTIEELQKGKIIHAFSRGHLGFYYYFREEIGAGLTVRQDTAINLHRDGLVESTKGMFAQAFELVPTDKFWEKYPKKGD